jgi:hemerythrin
LGVIRFEDVWNQKMELGIELLDGHHRTLMSLLVDLSNALEMGCDREFMLSMIDALKSYSKYHFIAEERFMLERKYPLLELQREEHRRFVGAIEEFSTSFAGSTQSHLRDLHAFLKRWLIDHILTKDKDFGEYYAPTGGRAASSGSGSTRGGA